MATKGTVSGVIANIVSWYSVYYRNKENDGEYSEWYPADELDTSLA